MANTEEKNSVAIQDDKELETSDGKPATGDEPPATGDGKPATGDGGLRMVTAFLNDLKTEVEGSLALSRTQDFNDMREAVFKAHVLSTIRLLVTTRHPLKISGSQLQKYVQSERRVNRPIGYGYIDILILQTGSDFRDDDAINQEELIRVTDYDVIVLELKYVPATFFQRYKDHGGSKLFKPQRLVSVNDYASEDPGVRRRFYQKYAMKLKEYNTEQIENQLQYRDPADPQKKRQLTTADLKKQAMKQALGYARDLPMRADVKIIVATLLGYGPVVELVHQAVTRTQARQLVAEMEPKPVPMIRRPKK